MDLRQLRYFVSIAELGSFSKAAEVLRIAQPSISQHMQNLEDELGVQLFSRHARGATMTGPARELYDHARRILSSVEHAKDAIQREATRPIERVSLGLSTSVARNVALPLFQHLSSHEAKVALHIVEAMPGYLGELLEAGRLDVAVLPDHRPTEFTTEEPLLDEDFVVLVRPQHPFAKRQEVVFSEIFDRPVVLPGRHHTLRIGLENLAARNNVTIRAVDCDSVTAMAKIVQNDEYATVMPQVAFLDEIARREIVSVPIVSPTPSWRLSIVRSERSDNPRGSTLVSEALAVVIDALVREGRWHARRPRAASQPEN
ncbi:LysR family transcriptional regulator [Mesorhizobium sp. SP-1A]|uniref:LysR family transcriptional regulator n=1 Tax=Mesorhizobium sp. SP-1A TaxID=3077840 RepID=UPI0028F70D1D|nr:LysR family transcriptional regulator [Mesorhizobium sp. SP-1A]